MEHPSDHPFERYIRDKMYSLRRTPSNGLWERIAKRQTSVRRREIRRKILFGLGSAVLLLLVVQALKYRSGTASESVQNTVSPATPTPAMPPVKTADRFPYQTTSLLNAPANVAGSSIETQQDYTSNPPERNAMRRFFPEKPVDRRQEQLQSGRMQTIVSQAIPARIAGNTDTTSQVPLNDFFTSAEEDGDTTFFAQKENPHILSVPLAPARFARKLPVPAPIRHPVLYDIRTHVTPKWRYGLSFTGGKLHESGNWQSGYFGAGIQVQYRLTDRIFLFGGLEWMRGTCRFNSKPVLGGVPEFSRSQFPHIPPFSPGTPLLNFHLQSDWSGFSVPFGVTIYRASKYRDLDWLLRPYYKPQFALQRRNRIWAPFTSLDNQLFQAGQHEWRAGWVGVQAGFDYRVSGRLSVEVTLNAEQALQPVGLEAVNYQAFSLRLALLRR